jgi:crotonobetaine/carnitine-CoA ligase
MLGTDAGGTTTMTDPWSDWTLPAVLASRAARCPAHAALIDADGQTITYAGLLDAARCAAGLLAAHGIGRGDPVGVLLPNRAVWVETWAALGWLGAVTVAINPELRGAFLRDALQLAECRALVVDAGLLPAVREVLAALPRPPVLFVDGAAPDDDAVDYGHRRAHAAFGDPAPVMPQDPAMIMYTSGTSGQAKAVLMPHAHCHLFGLGTCVHLDLGVDDRYYVALPLHHANGLLMQVHACLIAGATAVLAGRYSASRWRAEIAACGATHTNLLGATAAFILAQPPDPADRVHRLRVLGLAPTPPGLAGALAERFGIAHVVGMYGMTEVNIPLYTARDGSSPDGSCGRVWAEHFEVAVVDPDDDRPRAPGEVGELVVRPRTAAGFMAGYVGQPAATVAAWRNLWFHTGDAVRMDADGHVYFVDRIKDVIRRRGENLGSAQLEAVLGSMPGVVEVAALARPAPGLGAEDELVLVVVGAASGAPDAATVYAWCVRNLPRHAQPDWVDFAAALPKTPTGKVMKRALREAGLSPRAVARAAIIAP